MAVELLWSIGFDTEEGGVTRPVDLIMTIIDADGRNFRIFGRNKRAIRILGTAASPIIIPLEALGYHGLTSVSQIGDLYVQATGLNRALIVLDASGGLPAQMTSGFTIGTWNVTTGFNVAVATPPSSPSTILSYLLRANLDSSWSASVLAADLPEDVVFGPDNFPAWVFGVPSFNVDLTIAATSAAGTGPASAAVTKAVSQAGKYYVADADWSIASIDDEAPEGRVLFTFEGASAFAPPSPWQARAYVGSLPSGANAVTMLPLDWASIANTNSVGPASVLRIDTGLAEGATAYAVILLRNTVTGQFELGSEVSTVTVLALDVPAPIPTLLTGPTLSGLVNGQARVGVPVSGDATWSGTSTGPHGSFQRQNRIQIGKAGVGTLTNDAPAVYTPLTGDIGRQLSVRSSGFGSAGAQITVDSAAVLVVSGPPVVVGSIPDQSFAAGSGPWNVQAAVVAAAFSGANLVYSIDSSVATIVPSTGEVIIPSTAPITESIRVTATNSGGSAFTTFTLSISAGGSVFPPAIPESSWRVVEVRDPVEAGGVVGRRRLEWLAPVTAPAGFEIRLHASTSATFTWSNADTVVTPGTNFTTTNGLNVGATVFPFLGWKRISDGQFQTAAARPSFVIQGLIADPPPGDGTLPAFLDSQFSQATGMVLTDWGTYSGAGTNSGFFGSAMVVEALEAFRGRSGAAAHVLAQLRHNLGATRCVEAAGGFAAQHELRFVVTAALAKMTPAVWNDLSATEKTKIELCVKAEAIAGAYCCSTTNPDIAAGISKSRSLRGGPSWWRTNPNFSCAPPALVHAARVFLGASALSSFLNTLSISNFKAQLQSNGLTRTYNTFNALPATGSATGEGGSGAPNPSVVQVENAVDNWICATPDFPGQTVNDSTAAATSMMRRCFNKTIESGLGGIAANDYIGPGVNGWGRISANAATVPNRGQVGMAFEFDSSDADGARSALTPYVAFGTRVALDLLSVLAAAGLIDRNNSALQSAVAQMNRGMIDLDFKSLNGYRNWEKGTGGLYVETGTGSDGGLTWAMRVGSGSPRVRGYTLDHWFRVLHPYLTSAVGPPPPSTMQVVGSKTIVTISGDHKREEFRVRGNSINRDVDVVVRLPPGYAGGSANYHIVFATTGQSSPIDAFVNYSTLNALQNSQPMIWISFDHRLTATGPVNRSWGLNSPLNPLSQWQAFMAEAMPFFRNHYRNVGKKVACAGFSMGGFVGMHAALDLLGQIDAVSTMSSGIIGYTNSDFLDPVLGTEANFPLRRTNPAAPHTAANVAERINAVQAAGNGGLLPAIQVLVAPGESNYNAVQNWRTHLSGEGLLTNYNEGVTGGHANSNWSTFMAPCSNFIWAQLQAASPNVPTGPLYANSIASTNFDLIHASDPSAFVSDSYLGFLVREIPNAGNINVHVFRATFTDSPAIELYMAPNPIDGSIYANQAAAKIDVDRLTPRVGKLPLVCRRNIHHIIMYAPNGVDSGSETLTSEDAGHFFMIYSDRATTRINNNDFEESVFHEAMHASIQKHGTQDNLTLDDFDCLASPEWAAAKAADGPNGFITTYATTQDQEDFAEHALFAYTMIFHPERLPEPDRSWIQAKIPNRIAYFRTIFTP